VVGNDTRLVYDANGSPTRNAALASDSRIHGRSLMDAHAVWGGPHLRWVGWLEGYSVHSQLPWRARIVQSGEEAAGFTTAVRTTHFYDAAVTCIFFYDLPEVILFDIEIARRRTGQGGEFDGVAMCAFASDRYLYDGMRVWNDDTGPFPVGYGSGFPDSLAGSDPAHGIFLQYRGKCRYAQPHLTRGLVVAQRNGANGPENPPCGWIFRGRLGSVVTCDFGGYYAHMIVLHPDQQTPQAGDAARLRVLWFQGGPGNLDSLEKIFALEAGFSQPMRIERAADKGRTRVYARETAGKGRPWEFVALGPEFANLETRWPIFRGPSAVLLLKHVRPWQRALLGYLPVE
jgi:hypothetical protein